MSDNEENQKQTIDLDAQNTTCPHIKDAIRLENIEGPIEKLSSNLQCETCSGGNTKETDNLSMKTSNSSGSEHTLVDDSSPNTEPDPISARDLFLCLSCGQLNCGREDSKHALAHYNESKEHCIVINVKTLDTWCYACDNNLQNLTEDQSQTINKVQLLIREASKSKDIESEETPNPNELIKKSIKNKYRITAPGLQNLGNTCFFNSLMQVVAATSVLHDILDPSNPYYNPPLVSYKKCPAATSEDVGPLTDNFKSFLDMMWKRHDGTVNPKNLFQEISRKWQQFRGWRQQDSQEVMRYLFDGIKSEEFELIKKLSAHKKDDIVMEDGEVGEEDNDENVDDDDDDNDDDDDDVEVDEISSQGSINQKEKDKSSVQKYESFIDACFGGKLVSVIVCDTCDNCSYSYEEFLDVSLPIKSPNQTESQKYTNESATYYSTYDSRYGSRDDNSSPHSSGGDADIGDDDDAIAGSDDNDGQQKKFDDKTKPSAKSIKRKKRNKLLLRESHSNNNNNNKNIHSDYNNGNSFSYSSYSYNNYFSSSSIKENDISLIDCLNSFMRVETLEGDNAFACENCWKIKEKREKKLKQQKLQEQQKQQQEIIRKVEDADVIDNGEQHREMIEEQVNKNSNDDDDDDDDDDKNNFNNDDVVAVNDNNDNNYNKVEETDNMIISRTTPDHNTYEPNDADDLLDRGCNNDYNGDGTINGDEEAEESDDKMIISQTASNDAENPLNHDNNDSNNNSCNVVNSKSADNNNGYSTFNSNSNYNNNHSSSGDNNSNDDYSINDCSMFGASSNNNNNSSSTYNTPLTHPSSDTSNHNEMITSTESSSSSLMEREREREIERTTAREKSRSKSPPKPELQKAYKRYLFASLPPVLVFHLKRFQQVGSRWSMHMKKIDDFVSFEEEIDVGEFVVPPEIEEDEEEESDGTDADDDINNNYKRYKADEISNDDQVEEDDAKDLKKQQQQNKLIEQPSQSTKYRLYGVVVHLGSLFNGHYIAFVLSRNIVGEGEQTGLPNLSYDDRRTVNEIHKQAVKTGDGHRQWIYCSDSSVRSATVEEALSSGAYLLFYERVNE